MTGTRGGLQSIVTGHLGVPLFLLVLLAFMTLPMPTQILDLFFTFNIALSIIVLLVTIYALRPLDFAVFPSILLVATLLRLALNVASTRIVLLNGHEGGDAAGKVIEAFGAVLIGGNYAVGLVVFAILMIINFIVVTKGAGRVSEVSARFTLDAMPGKQMAIDADLNAGLIDADSAKARRQEIAQEADFYGSMDGASKFVRGDAVAGILILIINIVGGLAIGMAQHGLPFNQAVENYALLTIGDGLVAQIPSLLLSTAAAIMVTRNSASQEMGSQIREQMVSSPKVLGIAAGLLWIMGSVPGMPHAVFLSLAAVMTVLAIWMWLRRDGAGMDLFVDEGPTSGSSKPRGSGGDGGGKGGKGGPPGSAPDGVAPKPGETAREGEYEEQKELSWEDVQPVDMVGLEVGYRLIPLVDKSQGGQLLGRIKGVRKKLSQEIGFLIPSIHIRDNLDLLPNHYRITLMGVSVAEAEIHPERDMAINPGQVFGELAGITAKDPAFGLDAVWIESNQKDQAQALGYTVVDASTVVATHLNQVLFRHAHELLGHEEVQKLIDQLTKHSPKLAEELVPNTINISQLLKVLQNLLLEQVPIRDIRTIAEAITNAGTQDPQQLTAAARTALSRLIVQNIIGQEDELPVITLDRELEQLLQRILQQSQQSGGGENVAIEPALAEQLQRSVTETAQRLEAEGKPAVLLVPGPLRMMLARFFRFSVETLSVLAFDEVPENKRITVVATVGQ
ncbi:MAG: flagellar biosynthesis protein FlhA [Natronospirillum sp.]|uniref:flagellar biosynthesis protein FlhA n=1 Tax=Natronospirillum sp. TaxID=2812955 RepID=UPI0025E30176|nr:flagellar biosynthesis protein FlhA [Natronospirillum sp.]MCH8551288.1 flagellar biosynthesis protein FlhA [Natronospirillum sp.]